MDLLPFLLSLTDNPGEENNPGIVTSDVATSDFFVFFVTPLVLSRLFTLFATQSLFEEDLYNKPHLPMKITAYANARKTVWKGMTNSRKEDHKYR